MPLAMSRLHAEPTYAPARAGGLPALPAAEAFSCGDCGDDLMDDDVADRCAPCNLRARRKWEAARFAAGSWAGRVVAENLPFEWFLPAALARRGFALERRGVEWVVRSAT